VYFAGSVVPRRYAWRELLDAGRVEEVVNVVANGDWVVAIFPRFFEQVFEWFGGRTRREIPKGFFDIGSAGFRGFADADDVRGRVKNIQFLQGKHGAGVAVEEAAIRDAIVQYAVSGTIPTTMRNADRHPAWLDSMSNVSWVVWFVLVVSLLYGFVFSLAASPLAAVIYAVFVIAVLNSV